MIRPAVESDIPRVIDLVERLKSAVGGVQRVCRVATGASLSALINSPDGAVFVSGGGFIAGKIGQTVISPDPVAFELGWYATDRSGLKLLRAFERWAESKGALIIKMSCTGGAVQRLLERRGYEVAEVQMVKR